MPGFSGFFFFKLCEQWGSPGFWTTTKEGSVQRTGIVDKKKKKKIVVVSLLTTRGKQSRVRGHASDVCAEEVLVQGRKTEWTKCSADSMHCCKGGKCKKQVRVHVFQVLWMQQTVLQSREG